MLTNRSWKSTESKDEGDEEVIASASFTHLSTASVFTVIMCYI